MLFGDSRRFDDASDPLMSTEVGNESVNRNSRSFSRGPLAYHMLCIQIYRGLTAAYRKCGAPYQTSTLVMPELSAAHSRSLITQHAPDKDLSDLLDDAPSGPNPPSPSKSNLILPPRFFLPSGERAETHSSQCVQDVEVFLTTDTMQSGRGEYYGSTSPQRLVEFAIEFHDGAKSEPMPFEERFKNRRGEFWEVQDVSLFSALRHP